MKWYFTLTIFIKGIVGLIMWLATDEMYFFTIAYFLIVMSGATYWLCDIHEKEENGNEKKGNKVRE